MLLLLDLQGNDTMARIENVFAVTEGAEEPDRYLSICFFLNSDAASSTTLGF